MNNNDFDDTIPAIDTELVSRLDGLDEDLVTQRAAALRTGLNEYELDDEDFDVLDSVTDDPDAIQYLPALPVIAIVGRPNVGKSALVNRILGRREAVVEDTPGVTRDRVTYKGEWHERKFSLVDTGGWEPDAKGIDASVAAQAELAIELCDVVMFVVDAKKEKIAVAEANKLGIPIISIVDTNADPDLITVPIAGNDDAIRSVELITRAIADTIAEARLAAPVRNEPEEGNEGGMTYSSERGTESAGDKDDKRRRRPRRRRAKPEAIAAHLKGTEGEAGDAGDAEAGDAGGDDAAE